VLLDYYSLVVAVDNFAAAELVVADSFVAVADSYC